MQTIQGAQALDAMAHKMAQTTNLDESSSLSH